MNSVPREKPSTLLTPFPTASHLEQLAHFDGDYAVFLRAYAAGSTLRISGFSCASQAVIAVDL